MDKADCERAALDADVSRTSRTRRGLLKLAGFLGLALLVQRCWWAGVPHGCLRAWKSETALTLDDVCPQVEAFVAQEHAQLLTHLDDEFGSHAFRLHAYELLGGAVRIPTEGYDDIGPTSEDPRWQIMGVFHDYLESRFPRVHAVLKRTKVNTYALVYEWKGTTDAKPLLLAAHMDVVPVNPDTYDHWIYPPYSGYYDGEWIWGRGSCDDKLGIIGSLMAIEALLKHEFEPSRTVILAFGIDEESGGLRGAGTIKEYILETYGPDSLAMIVDEGKAFTDLNGMVFASPGIAEKGCMDIRMDVLTPGGHSGTPPKHTGIGILADLITELEAHPDQPTLIRGGPYYRSLECRAKYDTDFPQSLTQLLLESQTSDKKLKELGDRLIDFDSRYRSLTRTTQAMDLVNGGVKVNALPEVAWAAANYRIADHSSSAELARYVTDITRTIAAKHNMTLEAWGETVGSQGPSWGTIRLYDFAPHYDPAPVAPTTGSGPWELLSGTIRSTIQTHLRTDDLPKSVVVSPSILNANTDTKHYWNLTRHIFRYNHRWEGNDAYNGAHTINEAIRAEAFLEQIRFFARLILNADRSDLLD